MFFSGIFNGLAAGMQDAIVQAVLGLFTTFMNSILPGLFGGA